MILKISMYSEGKGSICCLCGEKITTTKKTRHHVIPQAIKPKMNIIIPLHNECHIELNKLMEINQEELHNRKLKLSQDDALVENSEQEKQDGFA